MVLGLLGYEILYSWAGAMLRVTGAALIVMRANAVPTGRATTRGDERSSRLPLRSCSQLRSLCRIRGSARRITFFLSSTAAPDRGPASPRRRGAASISPKRVALRFSEGATRICFANEPDATEGERHHALGTTFH
jgi:hypothetical protein